MSDTTRLQVGSQLQVRAYKSDGTCYRWWTATVEAIEQDQVIVATPAGHRLHTPDGDWTSKWAVRSYYWPDRWYSVLEVYRADETLAQIYVNINSPVEISDAQLLYTDYELDVSRELPGQARIVDEDEFQEAALTYGYSPEFQQTCYRVANEALEIANHWVAKGMPTIDARSLGKEQGPLCNQPFTPYANNCAS
jgi:protein associated with RNAse G/E